LFAKNQTPPHLQSLGAGKGDRKSKNIFRRAIVTNLPLSTQYRQSRFLNIEEDKRMNVVMAVAAYTPAALADFVVKVEDSDQPIHAKARPLHGVGLGAQQRGDGA
jgi:hypothetical protein